MKSDINALFPVHEADGAVLAFVQQWCYRDAVCNVVEGELCFDLS